jgi:hypothetical protein
MSCLTFLCCIAASLPYVRAQALLTQGLNNDELIADDSRGVYRIIEVVTVILLYLQLRWLALYGTDLSAWPRCDRVRLMQQQAESAACSLVPTPSNCQLPYCAHARPSTSLYHVKHGEGISAISTLPQRRCQYGNERHHHQREWQRWTAKEATQKRTASYES